MGLSNQPFNYQSTTQTLNNTSVRQSAVRQTVKLVSVMIAPTYDWWAIFCNAEETQNAVFKMIILPLVIILFRPVNLLLRSTLCHIVTPSTSASLSWFKSYNLELFVILETDKHDTSLLLKLSCKGLKLQRVWLFVDAQRRLTVINVNI